VKNYTLNFYLKIYLIILYLFAVFFFFQKYNNYVEWTISEWLINYQGGFTRRGLIGEIVFQISKLSSLTIRETILTFQITTYLLYFYLLYKFLKDTNNNILFIFAIFSPLFVIYPIAEVEVLGRKEIFIYVSFLLVVNIFSIKNIQNRHYFYFSIILMISCLIWEGFVIYISYFIFILILKNNLVLNKSFLTKLTISLIPLSISFYFVFFHRLDENGLKMMCQSINECYGAISYLNRSLSSNISEVTSKFQISFLIRYIIVLIIGFFPLFLLIKNSKLNYKQKFKNDYFYLIFFIIIFTPSLIFYYIAQDWGRWVSISYTLSLLTYVYSLKNNFIVINFDRINYSIFRKKFVVIFLFIIFAFGWAPKTLMNEDVGSIPIYRKSVEIIKSVIK
jgi:hypothetical protein